jgi:CPA2 family monovalent cation:H+ antiporter-2
VGARLLPWLFLATSRLGSSELFLLAVFATALLTAFVSSAVFGLSLALGAFVAGLIVSESDLSHQAAGAIIPFRDLFAVLFFVSVGMLLDPAALAADVPALVVLVVVAVGAKAALGAAAGRLLGMPLRSAILLGATIAQVGEFSFLVAERALALGILDARAYNLVLATAVVSIVATPLLLTGAGRLVLRLEHARRLPVAPPIAGAAPTARGEQAMTAVADADRLTVVILGAGRVGNVIVRAVRARGFRCVVVDRDQRRLEEVAQLGAATLFGDAASHAILARCGLEHARLLVVAIGDPLSSRLAVERVRAMNPRLTVVARARGRGRAGACAGGAPPDGRLGPGAGRRAARPAAPRVRGVARPGARLVARPGRRRGLSGGGRPTPAPPTAGHPARHRPGERDVGCPPWTPRLLPPPPRPASSETPWARWRFPRTPCTAPRPSVRSSTSRSPASACRAASCARSRS